MTEEPGRWWYFELAAEFPELEIYSGHGWGPDQELSQYELGERVAEEEALWLPTWFYSKARDRHWAATSRMLVMVLDRIRRDRTLAELVLHALLGTDPYEVRREEVPAGWWPDVEAWDEGKFNG
jgi:hypothetical protein